MEDAIKVDGVIMRKPFVMKPLDAEDHNIYVFFSIHDGGGAQHLYRKKKDTASSFLPHMTSVPEEGNFIFEQFMPTGGTDIKVFELPLIAWRRPLPPRRGRLPLRRFFPVRPLVCMAQVYTVGPNYAHAEGRKAPVVDGKVLRDSNGKEVRCPIMLTAFEKVRRGQRALIPLFTPPQTVGQRTCLNALLHARSWGPDPRRPCAIFPAAGDCASSDASIQAKRVWL